MSSETTEPCFPALIIDGSGSSIFTGVLGTGYKWVGVTEQAGAPLEELFHSVESTLTAAQLTLADIRSYIYCEGPGSVLGLRLCAMAMETWSRLYPESASFYSYNSLQLTAATLRSKDPELDRALIVSDWKKDAWNAISIDGDTLRQTEVIDDEQLSKWDGPLYHLPQRKGWQAPPENSATLKYDPSSLSEAWQNSGLLKQTEGVELYSTGINTFQKWTPTRHRAAK